MPRTTDKFYEVRQQLNNLHWSTLGFFKKKSDAEKYVTLYNTKVVVKPTQIVERNFTDIKDHFE
tara:strand:- start:4934 stop:5125 length:192 start_codon:yes stop_codon:yes gene_type:complete